MIDEVIAAQNPNPTIEKSNPPERHLSVKAPTNLGMPTPSTQIQPVSYNLHQIPNWHSQGPAYPAAHLKFGS